MFGSPNIKLFTLVRIRNESMTMQCSNCTLILITVDDVVTEVF